MNFKSRTMTVRGALLTAMSPALLLMSQPVAAEAPAAANVDSAAKLVAAIKAESLWNHLINLQRIADENPGPDGHGNRDTGTLGYKASVDHIATLMRAAGYRVSIQEYPWRKVELKGEPQFTMKGRNLVWERDWFVARLSAGGTVSGVVQSASGSGCGGVAAEFADFVPGHIALMRRGSCSYDVQVANATAAGAAGVILYNNEGEGCALEPPGLDDGSAFEARLRRQASLPVIGVVSNTVGTELRGQCESGEAPIVRLDIPTLKRSGVDYNVIADSPSGDSDHVVVVDAHLDSIFGAGILDNGSGSATILEVASKMARTPTRNQLRYIWFGGEEIGLLGSAYYTENLSAAQRQQIAFDVDVDVTATPNYDYLVADPAFAPNAKRFPPNVIPASKIGNQFFADYFAAAGIPALAAGFGNDGTDSNSFSLIGIPNTGILTQQDCCKKPWEVEIWGGVLGNYEGKIPSTNGGCVDLKGRWCDNLDNNDPVVFETASRASAYVIFQLANHDFAAGGL